MFLFVIQGRGGWANKKLPMPGSRKAVDVEPVSPPILPKYPYIPIDPYSSASLLTFNINNYVG